MLKAITMKLHSAILDLKRAISQYRVWLHLGWVEVQQRYRRSVLGPWWLSLSMLIFILMMGIVFSKLFKENLSEYIPFFTAGYLFWTFISNSLIEAAEIFKSNSGYIRQINLPFNLYVFKHLVRQLICLLHNSVVYLLVCLFFQKNPGFVSLLIIPSCALLLLNMYWVCFLVALVCARFRDMIPMISTTMQIAFFVTPISWMPKLLNTDSIILKINPLFYVLESVRAPLLGTVPSLMSWIVCCSMVLIGGVIFLYIFASVRRRIAFWVD